MNDVDDIEDISIMLEERIGVLEEENSVLVMRLSVLEEAFSQLENTLYDLENEINIRFDDVETDVQGQIISY